MTLQTRLDDFITAVGTDYKQFKTWMFGSDNGSLANLTTTDKSSLVAAINEAKAGNSGAPPNATEAAVGVVELATLTEMATGTDTTRVATVAGVRQERNAVKAEILGGATSAWDTLQEMKAFVDAAEESGDITALTSVVGTKANSVDVYTKTELGNVERDLVAAYTAAKA